MRLTQEQQVIQALRSNGGFSTLRHLNEVLDFSMWKTKTPQATVRRIVQLSNEIFRIRPGLWALEEARSEVLKKFDLHRNDLKKEELFSHAYYQGLLIEIGKFRQFKTYVPPQDKGRLFLNQPLGELTDYKSLPAFTYDHLLRKARTVDVIWFNEREMPADFYEVEHTTNIKDSLTKFYELQDFHSRFFIVAKETRRREFEDKLHVSLFEAIKNRVRFVNYEQVAGMHASVSQQLNYTW